MKNLVAEIKEFVDGYYDFQEDQKQQGVWTDGTLESYSDDAIHYLETMIEIMEKEQKEVTILR